MMQLAISLALAGSSAMAPAAPNPQPRIVEATPAPKAKEGKAQAGKPDEEFDIGKMMAIFDKMFPKQPDPPPERLALARATAFGVLPDGTYAAMVDELMSGMVDKVLAIRPADFGEGKDGKAGTDQSLRAAMAAGDPHFEERMTIARKVIGEELVKVSALVEPRLREGVARSIARRFEEPQLREINAFLATESGKAFGSQTMRMWMDPEVMRAMFQSVPEMVAAVPGAMKRLEDATAHLPPPSKSTESGEGGDDGGEEQDIDDSAS